MWSRYQTQIVGAPQGGRGTGQEAGQGGRGAGQGVGHGGRGGRKIGFDKSGLKINIMELFRSSKDLWQFSCRKY